MMRFGISGVPPPDADLTRFLDGLLERGHDAYELAFVTGFPWKERQCAEFGRLAAERDIALSVHAPYFAVLTLVEEDRAKQARAAVEHTMKLGRALRARVVVAHTGHVKDRSGEELHQLVHRGLERLAPKVEKLGVALGLETSGTARAFGTLGDIALFARDFGFVRPVVDWAHVHAMSGGGLTSPAAFASVLEFLRAEFPGWAIDPLHCQFTDNEFGPSGEIRHVPYGEGSLRVEPMVLAALAADLSLTVISEAKEASSHDAIRDELRRTEATARVPELPGRPVHSGRIDFPAPVRVVVEGDNATPVTARHPLRLSNIDKEFFPGDGYTKGDLLQYYASVAPLLLPHLEGRAVVMARFPDGASGKSFYEKQAPSHTPDWLPTAPLWSEHRDDHIDFVTAPDVESLLWIVNMGAIEIHPWLSRAATPLNPDFAIFDLDPADGATWQQVVDVAGHIKVVLDQVGLTAHVKTSGATGLHVYVPLEPVYDYRRVRGFVEAVGRLVVAADPDNVTMEWDIPRRAGKVFVDHNQNVAGKTIASVYSVRPRAGAPVSVPILWEELGKVSPADFTIASVWGRLQRFGDLFAPVLGGGQRLESSERAVGVAVDPEGA